MLLKRSRMGATTNKTGNAETNPGKTIRDEELAKAEVAVLAVIFLVAIAGNSLMIRSFWGRKKRMSRMYAFLMHLSMADLVVAVFQVLPQLVWDVTEVFLGPDPLCRAVTYLQLVGMLASSYTLVMMTVDRFQAVCHPIATFQKRRTFWNAATCSSWLMSLLLSLPQVFIFSKKEISPGVFQCWADFIQPWGLKAYVTWIFLIVFFIPTVVLTICQVKICKAIRMNIHVKTHQDAEVTHRREGVFSRASNINCVSKAMNKTVQMTVVIVLCYVLCWAPYFAVQLWTAWCPSNISPGPVVTILMLLGNLNSCTNPWIYMYFCGQVSCQTKHRSSCLDGKDWAVTCSVNLSDKKIPHIATAV